jgi:hypothetical protein
MKVTFTTGETTETKDVSVSKAIVAGWTGRDRVALEKHIVELEALGVARPTSTPIYYRVAASRITTAPVIETTGDAYVVVGSWEGNGCPEGDLTPFQLTVSVNGVDVDLSGGELCAGDLLEIIP